MGRDRSNNAFLALLAGAWRRDIDHLRIPIEDLEQSMPSITATGLEGLVCRRIDPLHFNEPFYLSLEEGYRRNQLQSFVHEIQVQDVFRRMRTAGIEPILFKGWGLARLYPNCGMRPYGDIDLWLPPAQLNEAFGALQANGQANYCVELHTSFYPQYERTLDDVIEQSRLIDLDGVDVRIPCPEDHLRFICLHFLYHGAWRPLWLCDVALMVESAGSEFDWDRCLSGNRKHDDWIACVIGLAHQFLGADIGGTPVQKRAQSLPHWLTSAVVRQWEKGPGMSFAENLSFSIPDRLLKPRAVIQAFREHWRNPIQASVEMDAWFSDSPRAVLQFSSAVLRIPEFAKHFGREIRRT